MATALDTKLRAVALSLITKFGANVTLHPASDGFDFMSGNMTAPAAGVVVKASPPLPMEETFSVSRDGVEMQDKLFYLDAITVEGTSVTPEILGSITHDSTRRQILAIEELWSGEQVAAYKIAVKG
jgi:hypothetical protein